MESRPRIIIPIEEKTLLKRDKLEEDDIYLFLALMGLFILILGLKSGSTSIDSSIECCVKCKQALILPANLKG